MVIINLLWIIGNMTRIKEDNLKEIYGGIAASTLFIVTSCVFAGISLLTNIVFGSLNIANASKQNDKYTNLEYSKTINNSANIVKML